MAFATMMAMGPVHAATQADPNQPARAENGGEAPRDAHPAKRAGRTDAKDRPGKTTPAKPQTDHTKTLGATGQGGDQKGHGAAPVVTPPPAPKPAVKETGEPPPKLPRFAAFKTDDTNMRKGPGQRYPIEWVYQRRDLPVEVEREYDVWRYVKDPDGVEGWVHQVTLSDRRTFMVRDKDATLRSDANETSSPVATLRAGVIGRLRECAGGSNWCQVQVGGYKGYLRRDQFWGLLPDEVVGPS